MKAKKILIIYSGAKVWGGIETYLENFFNYVSNDKLFPVLVSLGRWELGERLSKKGHRVITLAGDRIRFKTIAELVDLTKSEQADLLASQGVVANYYARRAARKSGLPLITTVHSDIEFDYPDEMIRLVYKLSDRLTRKYTTRFITVSKYLKKELIKSGIKEEKIKVIYNGVKQEKIKPKKSSQEIVVGSIGRFHHTKGYHNLILAWPFLEELPLKLVLFGDGEEKKSLEELVLQMGLSDRITFPGYARDKLKALNEIDIFIQPSLMEGFGLTVIEAMMVDKPVIVTPVGSLPEIVADSRTGLITDDTSPEALATAIKTLVHNPTLAKKLAKAGQKEVITKFLIDKWVKETRKTYLETD